MKMTVQVTVIAAGKVAGDDMMTANDSVSANATMASRLIDTAQDI